MIETESDLNRFKLENLECEWIVHIIPVEEGVHPVINKPCILFIRNTSTGKTYYYSFNHPDSISQVTDSYFIKECLLNMDDVKWVLDMKSFSQILRLSNMFDINLCNFFKHGETIDFMEFETPAHNLVRRNCGSIKQINKAISLMKHKEAFDDMCEYVEKLIEGFPANDSFIKVNDIIIGTLRDIESNGIHVDRKKFIQYFKVDPGPSEMVYSQYNIYTATGRPSNHFGGVNYAALNHTDGSRSAFVSRYGKDGRMVVVDYTTFHPRIVSKLTNYDIPIEIDIYEYLAKLYFQKKEVDETDIKNAKQLTFRQFYGGVEKEYEHIKYLANLKSYIDKQWKFFQEKGYVLTPFFKRAISHIPDPNPPKVFNYILQAAEGEIAIPRIQTVLRYLEGKKTKIILYTYDAVLLDFHRDDGFPVLNTIRQIMSFNNVFPVKTYLGNSYHDVKLIDI
jgi:hypothetical protein